MRRIKDLVRTCTVCGKSKPWFMFASKKRCNICNAEAIRQSGLKSRQKKEG